MSAAWCAGYGRAGHVHQHDSRGPTTVHGGPTPYRLCDACWRAWVNDPKDHR